MTARFKLRAANVEQNNVKGDKRFFLPLAGDAQWDEDAGEVVVPFEYRPLTADEEKRYGSRNQQDNIIAEAAQAIPQRLEKAPRAYTALTSERRRNGNGPVSNLEHHLRQYTRRNNSDFFIHKDLKGFLSHELDFYLKNEVLNLDEMENAGEGMAEGWFQMMRLIKAVGNPIIDFLEQIENFQKMLWEKRKFVADTQYCVTLANIAPDFYPAIADNDMQWTEWRELFDIDGADRSGTFLQSRPTLPLDTKHFDRDFTDALLASFDNLDGMTDGLLVHSENWQALNLLQDKYRERVKCIYIDPPYNTFASKILYKNEYEHSSWLSLLEGRILLSIRLLMDDAITCTTIDDYELHRLMFIMQRVFGSENHLATVAIRNNPSGRSTVRGFAVNHEYGLFFSRSSSAAMVGRMPHTQTQKERYSEIDNDGRGFEWENFRKSSSGNFRADRPRQYFPIYCQNGTLALRIPKMEWQEDASLWKTLENPSKAEFVILPKDNYDRERVWRYGVERTAQVLQEAQVKETDIGHQIYTKKYLQTQGTLPRTWWDKSEYSARDNGTRTLADLFGSEKSFDFPKAPVSVVDSIRVCDPGSRDVVLDYFAGSGTTGHAVINLNREDDGERKFILVEMGEYFDTVLLPRIKKVTFAPQWKGGKPQRPATAEEAERSPRIVKYIRLESYEDALNSIEFDRRTEQLAFEEEYDDYLLKYMLRWETKGSETLLNVKKLVSPFRYQLRLQIDGETRVKVVDVPETFNYLLGLNVRTRRVYEDDGRRYLVYQGETREAPGRRVAVIWRETEGWVDDDFERDREFVAEQGLDYGADRVYVNGDSYTSRAEAVERLFRERMFARADV